MKRTEETNLSAWIAVALSVGYPFLVLAVCFWMSAKAGQAGNIRRLNLSTSNPAVKKNKRVSPGAGELNEGCLDKCEASATLKSPRTHAKIQEGS